MTIIPIPVGPGPAPEHRWVGPEVARRVRARCTTAGVLLMLWAPVATVATLLVGRLLPTADHPIHDLGMVLAVAAAMLPLIVGTASLGGRRYVSAEHVDVAGGRVLGRGMLAMAIFSLVCATLASAVLLLTASAVERTDGIAGAGKAVSGYLLLPLSCAVFSIVGALLARRVLRAPPAPTPGRVGS